MTQAPAPGFLSSLSPSTARWPPQGPRSQICVSPPQSLDSTPQILSQSNQSPGAMGELLEIRAEAGSSDPAPHPPAGDSACDPCGDIRLLRDEHMSM